MPKKIAKKASSKVKSSQKKSVTSSKPKKTAGGSLSHQVASRRAQSPKAAQKASAILRDGRSSIKAKTTAGSALTQVQNPRTGRFVKVDTASGRIISHKKSRGAYKGVSITKNVKVKVK